MKAYKPLLPVKAAGRSRFGGLKRIAGVERNDSVAAIVPAGRRHI
jgi:hypothetical protein